MKKITLDLAFCILVQPLTSAFHHAHKNNVELGTFAILKFNITAATFWFDNIQARNIAIIELLVTNTDSKIVMSSGPLISLTCEQLVVGHKPMKDDG